jgi:hypothetical protein
MLSERGRPAPSKVTEAPDDDDIGMGRMGLSSLVEGWGEASACLLQKGRGARPPRAREQTAVWVQVPELCIYLYHSMNNERERHVLVGSGGLS